MNSLHFTLITLLSIVSTGAQAQSIQSRLIQPGESTVISRGPVRVTCMQLPDTCKVVPVMDQYGHINCYRIERNGLPIENGCYSQITDAQHYLEVFKSQGTCQ